MAALDFPASPSVGQLYPASPVAGVPTYRWDGEKWTTTGGAIGSTGASDATPLADGTAAPGSSTLWSRGDHRHPTDPAIAAGDALKAPLASPAFTGNPTAPTPANADNDTSLATTAFVRNNVQLPANADFNTITDGGTYFTNDSGSTNVPAASQFWWLQVFKMTGGSALVGQFAMSMITGSAYVRYFNGSWQAWRLLYDTNMAALTAEYIGNSQPNKLLTVGVAWASVIRKAVSANSFTPDFNDAIDYTLTVSAGAITINAPTNFKQGQRGMIVLSGISGNAITFNSVYRFPGGAKPANVSASGTDIISYVCGASVAYCTYMADMK